MKAGLSLYEYLKALSTALFSGMNQRDIQKTQKALLAVIDLVSLSGLIVCREQTNTVGSVLVAEYRSTTYTL